MYPRAASAELLGAGVNSRRRDDHDAIATWFSDFPPEGKNPVDLTPEQRIFLDLKKNLTMAVDHAEKKAIDSMAKCKKLAMAMKSKDKDHRAQLYLVCFSITSISHYDRRPEDAMKDAGRLGGLGLHELPMAHVDRAPEPLPVDASRAVVVLNKYLPWTPMPKGLARHEGG
eukprot:g11092.t1